MDGFWLPVAIFAFTTFGGALAGVALLLIGGTGVTRLHGKRLASLEQDIDSVSDRLTRETKRRSGLAGAEARSEAQSYKDLKLDAERRLALDSANKAPIIPMSGLPSQFNRG